MTKCRRKELSAIAPLLLSGESRQESSLRLLGLEVRQARVRTSCYGRREVLGARYHQPLDDPIT